MHDARADLGMCLIILKLPGLSYKKAESERQALHRRHQLTWLDSGQLKTVLPTLSGGLLEPGHGLSRGPCLHPGDATDG